MANVYRFPSYPEINEEQQRLWDAEMQAIMEDADKKAALAVSYICDPPSDNPFEQMARERCYNELNSVSSRMARRKTSIADKLLIKDNT